MSRHLDTIQNLVFIHPAKKRRNQSSKEDSLHLLQQEGEEREKANTQERVNKEEEKTSQAYLDSQREDENVPPVFCLDRVMKNPMYVDTLRDLVSQLEGDFLRLATFYSTCSSVLEGNEEEEDESEGFFFTSERKKIRANEGREEGKEAADREENEGNNLAVIAGVEAAVSTLHMRVMASNTYGTAQVYVHPRIQEEGEGEKKKNGNFEVPCKSGQYGHR